jgi:hypothetical protein
MTGTHLSHGRGGGVSKLIKTKSRIKYRQGVKAADFKDSKLEYSCMCDAVFNALPVLSLEKVRKESVKINVRWL